MLAAALVLAGCSSSGGGSFLASVMAGTSVPAEATTSAAAREEQRRAARLCPEVQILSGAQTFATYQGGREGDPGSLRHQALISQTARECTILDAEMFIRVGVAGRLIAGPKGGPGTVRVPIRFTIVSGEGTVETRPSSVSVTLPAGQGSTEFSIVEDQLAIPTPERPGGYLIYVGFDTPGNAAWKAVLSRRDASS